MSKKIRRQNEIILDRVYKVVDKRVGEGVTGVVRRRVIRVIEGEMGDSIWKMIRYPIWESVIDSIKD